MFNGLKFEGDLQYRVNLSDTSLAANGSTTVGRLVTGWCPDYESVTRLFELSVADNKTAEHGRETTHLFESDYFTPPDPVVSGSGGGESLMVLSCQVYVEASGVWTLAASGLSWKVNGSEAWNSGPFTISSGTVLRPSAIPGIGLYSVVRGVSGVANPYADGPLIPGGPGLSNSAAGTVTAGWRSVIDGTAVARPIIIDAPAFLGSGATAPLVSGTDSWNVAITTQASLLFTSTTGSTSENQGAVMIVPSGETDRGMIRMEPGNGSLVLRYGMPVFNYGRASQGFQSPSPESPGGPDYFHSDTGEVMPAMASFLGIAGDEVSTVEEAILTPTKCLFDISGNRGTWNTTDPTWRTTESVNSFGGVGSFSTPGVANYLRNLIVDDNRRTWAAMTDTWASPFWPNGLFNSPDSPFDPDELKERSQQHLFDVALPGDTPLLGHLSNVVAEGLDQNGLVGLWQEVALGCPCPWGIDGRGIHTRRPTIASELELDERTDGRWTYAGDGSDGSSGTGSIDSSGIHGDVGQTVFDFALGSYTIWPYQTSHLAALLKLTTVGATNVDSISAKLVGFDGAEVHIVTVTPEVPTNTVRIPRGTDTKWWISAGQSFGGDTYVGVASGAFDGSSAVAGDPEISTAMASIGLRAGMKIRFTVTPTDAEGSVVWPFPVLYPGVFPSDEPSRPKLAIRNDAASVVMAQVNGPGVRYGQEDHYDVLTDSIIAQGLPWPTFDRKREAGDLLVWQRLWLEARAFDDGLDAEIATLYEDGVEYTMRKHLWRDPFTQARVTHSFIAQGEDGPAGIMVSSYRAVPPIGLFPTRKRSKASNWEDTGDWGDWSYTLDQTRNWCAFAPPRKAKGLYHASADTLTYVSTAAGWSTGYHSIAVDNSESFDWEARDRGPVAKVKPYRGYVWTWWQPPDSGPGRVFLRAHPSTRWAHGFTLDGEFWIEWFGNTERAGAPVNTGILADWCAGAWGLDGVTWVVLGIEGDAVLYKIDNEGGTPALATTLGAATSADIFATSDVTLPVYRLDGGTVSYHLLGSDGVEFDAGDTDLTGLDDEPISAYQTVDGMGGVQTAISAVLSGTRQVFLSSDGIHFS